MELETRWAASHQRHSKNNTGNWQCVYREAGSEMCGVWVGGREYGGAPWSTMKGEKPGKRHFRFGEDSWNYPGISNNIVRCCFT